MVKKIEWSLKAITTYAQNIKYLKEEWSLSTAQKFTETVNQKIDLIANKPVDYRRSSKVANVYFVVINKRIKLFYKINNRTNTISLLLFWNSWKNPSRLKY
jgi:plasmid stabilization system protein ParE